MKEIENTIKIIKKKIIPTNNQILNKNNKTNNNSMNNLTQTQYYNPIMYQMPHRTYLPMQYQSYIPPIQQQSLPPLNAFESNIF